MRRLLRPVSFGLVGTEVEQPESVVLVRDRPCLPQVGYGFVHDAERSINVLSKTAQLV